MTPEEKVEVTESTDSNTSAYPPIRQVYEQCLRQKK